jgi:hypothetical protein
MQTCYYPFHGMPTGHRAAEIGRWLTRAGEVFLMLNMHRNNAHKTADAWCCERTDYPGEADYRP